MFSLTVAHFKKLLVMIIATFLTGHIVRYFQEVIRPEKNICVYAYMTKSIFYAPNLKFLTVKSNCKVILG